MDVRREPVRLKDLGGLAADVLDTIKDGFYILDADWRLVYANPKACELVVEDNEDVLRATVDVLRALNYKVFVASTGPEALEVIRRGETVDLLLSDIVMPAGMTGIELAHEARQLRPSVRVLLTSGYSA